MHSLDINFLNDRTARPAAKGKGPAAPRGGGGGGNNQPLLIGLALGIVPIAAILGFWGLTQSQVGQLRERDRQLTADIAALNAQLEELNTKRQQIDAITAENTAMGSILKQIRPWSALLFDIQQRTPPRIQIASVVQTEGYAKPNPDGTDGTLPPLGGLEISGFACTFDDINDFILVLRQSDFFVEDELELVTAALLDDEEAELGRCPGDAESVQAIKLIDYTIRGNVVGIPDNPEEFQVLLSALERNNAIGLVARIRALQNIGVIEP